MDQNIKISVIIPAYNAENTIVKCIESVLIQTNPIHEIVIINDGSNDNTVSVVNKLINTNTLHNIILLNQNNAGPSIARNNGIKYATGNWIAFLDADDIWLPYKIEKQIEFYNFHPEFLLIGTLMQSKKNINSSDFKIITFASLLYTNLIFTSTVLVRKSILENYYFDEKQRYSEDYKLWLQIAKSHKVVVLLNELVLYNALNENANSLSKQLWAMEVNELKNYFHFYKTNYISLLHLFILCTYSFFKFIRRVVFNCFRN